MDKIYGPRGGATKNVLKATARRKPDRVSKKNLAAADAFDMIAPPVKGDQAISEASLRPSGASVPGSGSDSAEAERFLGSGALVKSVEAAADPDSAAATAAAMVALIDDGGVIPPAPKSPFRERTISQVRLAQALRRSTAGDDSASSSEAAHAPSPSSSPPSPGARRSLSLAHRASLRAAATRAASSDSISALPPPPPPLLDPSETDFPPPPSPGRPSFSLASRPLGAKALAVRGSRASADDDNGEDFPPPPSPGTPGKAVRVSDASAAAARKTSTAAKGESPQAAARRALAPEPLVLDDPLALETMIVRSPFLQRCIDLCTRRGENPFKDRNFKQLSASHLTAVMEKLLYSQNSILLALRFMPGKSDVTIVGMPRSGMTVRAFARAYGANPLGQVVARLVDSLKHGVYAPLVSLPDRVVWPEAIYCTDLPAPGQQRIIRTHLPLKRFFEPHMNKGKPGSAPCKIVVVLRDPLDMRVSWYRLVRRLAKKLAAGFTVPGEFDSVYNLDAFVDAASAAVSLDAKEDDMIAEGIYVQLSKLLRSPDVLIVFYEDVVKRPDIVVRDLARFTELGSPDAVDKILSALKKDEAHPMSGRRVGCCGAGAGLFSNASQRKLDAHWDRLVGPLVKAASYEAFYEAVTSREYPYGNRRRLLDEDLRRAAAGNVLRAGSFNNLVSAGGAQLRRATNLDAAAPVNKSFFGLMRRSSKPSMAAASDAASARPSSLGLAETFSRSSFKQMSAPTSKDVDPDESDDDFGGGAADGQSLRTN